jgi:hypothetical protein
MKRVSFEQIEAEFGIKTEMGKELLKEAIDLAVVLDGKNADYSSANISKFGLFGIVVRLSDKLERMTNLLDKVTGKADEIRMPVNESLEDTCLDIAGYGLIAKIVARKGWK